MANNDVVTWQYCKECGADVTPRYYLSRGAARISFARFLELFLLGRHKPAVPNACPHSVFGSHVFFFAKNNLCVAFEQSRVITYPFMYPPRHFLAEVARYIVGHTNRYTALTQTGAQLVQESSAGADRSGA